MSPEHRPSAAMPTPCCYRAALDPTQGFCGECGAALLRCAAFEECGGLVGEDGACGVCLAPELALDAGGAREARVGGALALPLVLTNRSRVGRPLFVKGLWTREDSGEWRALEPSWERLDGGASAPLLVRTNVLQHAGAHRVEVLVALATRWRWREEVAAWTAGVEVRVDADEAVSVTQNISYDASASQAGATIYAPLKLDARRAARADDAPERRALELVRAGRLERLLGLRGDPDGPTVARGARLEWRGFAPGHAPADGPLVSGEGVLVLGRSRARAHGGPNDVRLLALAPDGRVDDDASRGISRHHLGLSLGNGRLLLHVESDRGAWVNGERVARGAVVALRDGDRFSPLPRAEAPLSVQVRLDAVHDVAERVTLTRHPAETRGATS